MTSNLNQGVLQTLEHAVSENMFTLNFCGQEWIFPMVVNLVHESMYSMFVFMRVQEKYLSQSLW